MPQALCGTPAVEVGVGGRVAGQERGHLLLRRSLMQRVQQPGHAVRLVEVGVGGFVVCGFWDAGVHRVQLANKSSCGRSASARCGVL
ncbi:hypothetical protein M2158_004804 [Streptomyces sp. SAI-144]|uniref:hypothetical protein n=1 Tax=unclassified Streptomyces TaxID=2593676 RepID=UPI0024750984|nr:MULTISPECIES: hypothetical protein [unclassified Streptomyces]MDH6436264.1 hypothetical protein [Streptomyces sp. SAI-144]MDH6493395.1 hypothetical protein [Streptomyces sp. SAI-127]